MEPLAERLRPRTLEQYIGQRHLVGEGAVLRRMIEAKRISSFILWGPPGVGKTTLAQIIAHRLDVPFHTLSAVTSGVKDVRDVIERAQKERFFNQPSPILFIDEIHRFSKSQQDCSPVVSSMCSSRWRRKTCFNCLTGHSGKMSFCVNVTSFLRRLEPCFAIVEAMLVNY